MKLKQGKMSLKKSRKNGADSFHSHTDKPTVGIILDKAGYQSLGNHLYFAKY